MDGLSEVVDVKPNKRLSLIFFQYGTMKEIPYYRNVIENTTLSKIGYHLGRFSNVGILISGSDGKHKLFYVSNESDNVFGAFINIKYNYVIYTDSPSTSKISLQIDLNSDTVSELEDIIELIMENNREIKSAYLYQMLHFLIPSDGKCSCFGNMGCFSNSGEWEKLKNTDNDGGTISVLNMYKKIMFDNIKHGYPSEIICSLLQLTTGLLKDENPHKLTISGLYIKLTQLTDIVSTDLRMAS